MPQRSSFPNLDHTTHAQVPISESVEEEEVEEVVRKYANLPQPANSIGTAFQFMRPSVGDHIKIDELLGASYQMLQLATKDSRASVDGSDISSLSALTMTTSATSSGSDHGGSSTGMVEEDEDCQAIDWDEQDLVVPKLEPIDDIHMEGLSPVSDTKERLRSATPTPMTMTLPQLKRPRGRPRKHPKPTPESLSKVAKGRSKTGCLTCRKRKKKCDETKPTCLNCEKNSVTCEGYPEKTIWRSGKEKAEEARVRRAGSFAITSVQLPTLINGIETEGDRIFLHHYVSRLSVKFTLEGNETNAFRNIMLPMAQQHSGLMHSILALSGRHLDFNSEYGLQILRNHPSIEVTDLEERTQFHKDAAIKELISAQCGEKIAHATYAQMICLVLETLSDPAPNGQHRFHLQHYQRLVEANPPSDEDERMKFIHEFFQYHIGADQLIHLPAASENVHFVSTVDDWNLPSTVLQPSAVRLLGVFDGLFLYMSKITTIRNNIRRNIELKREPIVDYHLLYAAAEIDAGIREWMPVWPPGDSRDTAGFLYKQMMWIYLWRTIYPPQTTNWTLHPAITVAVNGGLELLARIGSRDPSQTLVLAPAFVIGCAAFEEKQREPIRRAIAMVKDYMEYRNTDTALRVLEEVWRLMDAKDERSWDWQAIAKRMGMDFLAT